MLGTPVVYVVLNLVVFAALLELGKPCAGDDHPKIDPPVIVSAIATFGTLGFLYPTNKIAHNSRNAVSVIGKSIANARITVFERRTQLGTTLARTDGSWSLKTAPLRSGDHEITATATVGDYTSVQSAPTSLSINSLITINSNDPHWIYANGSVDPSPFTWNIDSGPDQSGTAGLAQVVLDPAMMPNLSGPAVECAGSVCNCRFYWQAPSNFIRRWSVHRMVNIKYVQHNLMSPQFSHIGNFRSMPAIWNVSIGGDTEDINVAWDIFFFPEASETVGGISSQVAELMLWVHQPITNPLDGFSAVAGGKALYTLSPPLTSGSLINLAVANAPARIPGIGNGWELTAATVPRGAPDVLSGTTDIATIIKRLIWEGFYSGQEYVDAVLFGSEVAGGTGNLIINSYDLTWNFAPSVMMTPDAQYFAPVAMGGNNVTGSGASGDTVVYHDLRANYQIKTWVGIGNGFVAPANAETLIIHKGDFATLDIMQLVKFIKFSDCTYNVVTGACKG
jgi:hypothetical protein